MAYRYNRAKRPCDNSTNTSSRNENMKMRKYTPPMVKTIHLPAPYIMAESVMLGRGRTDGNGSGQYEAAKQGSFFYTDEEDDDIENEWE